MTNAADEFAGSCHCGAARFSFSASRQPARWPIRACQCSFCRAHGARTTSDAQGSVAFDLAEPAALQRYRFGTRSADFLICGRCGVYLAAVITTADGQFATLNVNAIRDSLPLQEAVPVSYEGESVEQREARRAQRWTPVAGSV